MSEFYISKCCYACDYFVGSRDLNESKWINFREEWNSTPYCELNYHFHKEDLEKTVKNYKKVLDEILKIKQNKFFI